MRAEDRTKDEGSYILAAGAILERQSPEGLRVAVLHRKRYQDADGRPGDYVLPKGKVEPGESLEQAALREVEEETGCRGRIVGAAFPCEYLVGGIPKIVQFFLMSVVAQGNVHDTSEVQEVLWLSPEAALARLTYDTERTVLRQAYPHLSVATAT
jgi:8-oxo-dGTP diphosphatase